MDKQYAALYSRKSIVVALVVSVIYFLISYLLIGFKTDQLLLAAIFNTAFFLSPVARKFILGFSIFIVYWILFDYMKAFPNYTFNSVHIQDLYNAERSLFGINYHQKIITPNEYWLINKTAGLTIMSGLFYLCWIPVPLAFAAWLFFKDKNMFLHFSLTFVLVNFIGFVIYYIYPAAPPWYYRLNGPGFIASTPGNTAGLQQFDNYFHVNIFEGLYAKSSNVFAAMPSLHSSYPLIVFYFGVKKKLGLLNIVFAAVVLGIWFSAVYTSHHYILDVLAGISCAVAGIFIFEKILVKSTRFNRFLNMYKGII